MPAGSLRAIATLAWKDVLVEARDPRGLWVQAAFTASAGVLAASAASRAEDPAGAAASAYALASLFLALLASHSAFTREALTGTVDGLRAAPVEGWVHVASKTILVAGMAAPQLFALGAVAALLTPGLDVAWGPLAAWSLASALYLGAVAAFVSAVLAFGEQRGGSAALAIVALAAPYLHASTGHLEAAMAGAAPPPGSLAALAGAAVVAAAVLSALGGAALE